MEKGYCFFRSNFSFRRFIIVFLFSILSTGSIGYSESLPAVSVDYVINGMKHRESFVNSARATFTLKITDELTGDSATNEFEWAMKGNSRYLKSLDNEQKFVQTYDGVYSRHYRIRANFGSIEKTWGLSDTSAVPDIFGFYFYGQPLSRFFEVNKATLLPKTETIEDQECYVIEVIGPAPQKPPIGIQALPDVKIKAWVNPKRGFSVVQLEQGFLHYKLSRIYRKIRWKEFGNDIWFPVSGERRGAEVVTELTVKEIKINIDISDQLFKKPGWKNNTKITIWDDMLQKTVDYNESLQE